MSNEHWKLWKGPRTRKGESRLFRYGGALLFPFLAGVIVYRWPVLADDPFFVFLAAVVLSAANGGLAASFVSTALSALIIRLLFAGERLSLHYGSDLQGMVRMGGFAVVALLLGSIVSGMRRERNNLRDSEERYRILAQTASDAIIVIDEMGEIIYANPVSEKIFGVKAQELVGKNLESLLPGETYHTHILALKHHLDTRKQPVAVQLPGRHRTGKNLLVEMTLGASCHRGESVFTAIIRDITGSVRPAT